MNREQQLQALQRIDMAIAHIRSAKTLLANARDLTAEGDLTNMCNSSLTVAGDNLLLLNEKIIKAELIEP